MKVIAGLGNPGREYAQTKHNVGFLMVDALAAHLGVTEWREKYDAFIARARIGSEAVLLVKPQTYMNESGRAIAPLMNFYKLAADDLIVAHDDMDIPVGSIRIRKKGSSGGHNGIKSLDAMLGSEYERIRIGVGRGKYNVIDFVLGKFSAEELELLEPVLKQALSALDAALKGADIKELSAKYSLKAPKLETQKQE